MLVVLFLILGEQEDKERVHRIGCISKCLSYFNANLTCTWCTLFKNIALETKSQQYNHYIWFEETVTIKIWV
jgi:hypothetical protein